MGRTSLDETKYTVEGILIPNGVEIRRDKKDRIINSNIICLEAYLQAVKNDVLRQESSYKTFDLYTALTGFIRTGLSHQAGMDQYFKQGELANKLQKISISLGFDTVEDVNAKLLETGEELLQLIRDDSRFNDYFNDPKIAEMYKRKGPMTTAKYLKKKNKGALGICTVIDPWESWITKNEKLKW